MTTQLPRTCLTNCHNGKMRVVRILPSSSYGGSSSSTVARSTSTLTLMSRKISTSEASCQRIIQKKNNLSSCSNTIRKRWMPSGVRFQSTLSDTTSESSPQQPHNHQDNPMIIGNNKDDNHPNNHNDSNNGLGRGVKHWRLTTQKLLNYSPPSSKGWTLTKLRQAEQCLFYWRTNTCRDQEAVVRLWQKLKKENPHSQDSSHTITLDMYAYAVTALSFHAFPRAAQVVLEELYALKQPQDLPSQQQAPPPPSKQQQDDNHPLFRNYDYTHVHLLNDVIHAYAKQKEPQIAEELLRKAFQHDWISSQDVHSVASALDAWSRVGNGPRAQALLEWILRERPDMKLDVTAYNTVLTAWARTDPPQNTKTTTNTTNNNNGHRGRSHPTHKKPQPHPHTKKDDLPAQRAQQLLEHMEQQQQPQQSPPYSHIPKPNAASYSTVIVAWGQSKEQPWGVQQAEQLLGRAHSNKCANQICFNAVLHAWAKQGDPQRAFRLLEAWLQDVKEEEQPQPPPQLQINSHDSSSSTTTSSSREAWPDVTSFNTVIDALAKSGNVQAGLQAEALLPWMKDLGIVPDEITCNTILSAYAKSGHVEAAMKLLNRLEQDWTTTSSATATTSSSSLSSSSHQGGGVHPRQRRIAYNTVIMAWMNYAEQHCHTVEEKEEAGNQADQMLDRMQRHGVMPDSYTYNNILKALSIANMETAESFLNYMETSDECGVRPDNFTYITLMDAWAKRRYPERAYAILRRMEQSRNPEVYPNVVAYNMIVNAYAKSSDPYAAEEAEAILTKLEQQFEQPPDYHPTTHDNNNSRRSSSRSFLLPAPDLLTYASTISAWSYSPDPNRGQRAWDVLQRMLSNVDHAQNSNYRSNHADILRNAHNMVLAACAGSKGEYRQTALKIALETFQMCGGGGSSGRTKNHVTYTSFFKCVFHLQDDLPKRHSLLADAFLDHCHASNRRVHKSVLARLEKVTPPEISRAILQKAGIESRQWRR